MSIRRPVVAGDGHLSRGLSDRLRHVLAISCIENTHSPDDLYPASGGGTEVYARKRQADRDAKKAWATANKKRLEYAGQEEAEEEARYVQQVADYVDNADLKNNYAQAYIRDNTHSARLAMAALSSNVNAIYHMSASAKNSLALYIMAHAETAKTFRMPYLKHLQLLNTLNSKLGDSIRTWISILVDIEDKDGRPAKKRRAIGVGLFRWATTSEPLYRNALEEVAVFMAQIADEDLTKEVLEGELEHDSRQNRHMMQYMYEHLVGHLEEYAMVVHDDDVRLPITSMVDDDVKACIAWHREQVTQRTRAHLG